MAEPMMSPIPHSFTIKNVATTFVQNSGALDPNASSVAPATSEGMPRTLAKAMVDGTKYTSEITFKFLKVQAMRRADKMSPHVQGRPQLAHDSGWHSPKNAARSEKWSGNFPV